MSALNQPVHSHVMAEASNKGPVDLALLGLQMRDGGVRKITDCALADHDSPSLFLLLVW